MTPLEHQLHTLAKTGMTRFFRRMFDDYPDLLMKDVTVERIGPDRTMLVGGSGFATLAPTASSVSTSTAVVRGAGSC